MMAEQQSPNDLQMDHGYAAESLRLYLEPLGPSHLEDYHAIQSNEKGMMWS